MNAGVELVCERSRSVDDTTYFSVHIEVDGAEVPSSRGRDRYMLCGMVLPSKRIAATGRQAEYRHADTGAGIGLGAIEAAPSRPCALDVGPSSRIEVVVENNAVLDLGEFCMDFSMLVNAADTCGRRTYDISLRRPDVSVAWPRRGVFRLNITRALLPEAREH